MSRETQRTVLQMGAKITEIESVRVNLAERNIKLEAQVKRLEKKVDQQRKAIKHYQNRMGRLA